ncbi:MAG: class I SAM-dependent methyltransferase [Armatimonadetes bacterium]|nr:class I SAM-dependent methyltransferase [Armatimonadota bacterium]
MERLVREQGISPEIAVAFRAVPREEFLPEWARSQAYSDSAIAIGDGATNSQPSMLAIMLQELALVPGMKVLEVGSGSGYLLALLSCVGVEATGVEVVRSLAEKSVETLARLDIEARVIVGNAGVVRFANLYDRVVFSAAIAATPAWATGLLAPGGFVLAPVGYEHQQELVRADGSGQTRTGRLCRFVRFVD